MDVPSVDVRVIVVVLPALFVEGYLEVPYSDDMVVDKAVLETTSRGKLMTPPSSRVCGAFLNPKDETLEIKGTGRGKYSWQTFR